MEEKVAKAKKVMEEASSRVEEAMHKETLALEKLKAAKMAKTQCATNTQQAESDKVEAEKTIKILELELSTRQQKQELEEAEKAAQEALKACLVEQKQKEAETLREHAEANKE